jgi:hypothetical protein
MSEFRDLIKEIDVLIDRVRISVKAGSMSEKSTKSFERARELMPELTEASGNEIQERIVANRNYDLKSLQTQIGKIKPKRDPDKKRAVRGPAAPKAARSNAAGEK